MNQSPKLSDSLKINISLSSQNYALWARMIKVAIGGKLKHLLNHLTSNPPDHDSEEFDQWEQEDLIVFSWLIQNIEPNLISNLTEFATVKLLWDALGIWGEIDRRDPNPMKCSTDIAIYNKIRTEQKLFQFLNALDRNYDTTKRELLRIDLLSTPEEAYATVRKEVAHQHILGQTKIYSNHQGIASGLVSASKTDRLGQTANPYPHRSKPSSSKIDKSKLVCTKCGKTKHTREQCFEIKGYPNWWNKSGKAAATVAEPPPTTTIETELGSGGLAAHKTGQVKFSRSFYSLFENCNPKKISNKVDLEIRKDVHKIHFGNKETSHEIHLENKLTSHVMNLGNTTRSRIRVHNKSSYMLLGLEDGPNKLAKNNGLMDLNNRLSKRSKPTSNIHRQDMNKIKNDEVSQSEANIVSKGLKTKSWILDCGATDTMTFDKNDITFNTKPKKDKIQTANGEIIHVKGGGTIKISPTIKLPNCLYIPVLSHKLLSGPTPINVGWERGGTLDISSSLMIALE
ncbi:uncharacterized protein [Rutidosis leptorrhynchoides]|uniref:uncharacterized protein n=1 Tax=Rutidosis leptorrhynchoides TaxID=125765 RepID=UPI003A9A3A82